jgi:hypothetical protein
MKTNPKNTVNKIAVKLSSLLPHTEMGFTKNSEDHTFNLLES